MLLSEFTNFFDFNEDKQNKQVIVVLPGRFQPWHKGHKAVYDHLVKKYGYDNVYICTSDKVEPPRSPFNFQEKLEMMKLTGVDPNRVVQSKQPYQALEIVNRYDAQSTIVIFAVSEKDMAEDPRFQFKPKKDGSPSYFQPLPANIQDAATLDRHGYITTVPTFNFNVLGQPMRSATEVRAQFAQADEQTKKAIIKDLFGNYSNAVYSIMAGRIMESADNARIEYLRQRAVAAHPEARTPEEALDFYIIDREARDVDALEKVNRHEDAMIDRLSSLETSLEQKIDDLYVKFNDLKTVVSDNVSEDAAGVGVVAKNKKMAKDPRYSMSITQDVKPSTPQKMAKAFRLA